MISVMRVLFPDDAHRDHVTVHDERHIKHEPERIHDPERRSILLAGNGVPRRHDFEVRRGEGSGNLPVFESRLPEPLLSRERAEGFAQPFGLGVRLRTPVREGRLRARSLRYERAVEVAFFDFVLRRFPRLDCDDFRLRVAVREFFGEGGSEGGGDGLVRVNDGDSGSPGGGLYPVEGGGGEGRREDEKKADGRYDFETLCPNPLAVLALRYEPRVTHSSPPG